MSGQGEPNVTETAGGIIVGADPRQPPQTTEPYPPNPAQQVTQPVQQPPQQPNGDRPRYFTEEEVAEIRRQEKDKVYGRLDSVQTELKAMKAEREAEKAEKQALADQAAAALKAKEEGEMEVRDLLARREQEWNDRLSKTQAELEADRAVFQQERRLAELDNYRRARLEQESQFIIPEVRDAVTGSTPEEIDASIEEWKARSEQIVAAFLAEQPPLRGASTSAPTVGPMEQMPQYESLTPDDIRGMDMETYKRYRDQLLAATNPNRQRGR